MASGTDARFNPRRTVPAWLLSALASAIALGLCSVYWLDSTWILPPAALILWAGIRPGPGKILLVLVLVVISLFAGPDGPGPVTFVYVAGVHLVYLLYALTSAVPWHTRITAAALGRLGLRFLRLQLACQALALLALVTAGAVPDPVIAVLAGLVVAGLAVLFRAAPGTG